MLLYEYYRGKKNELLSRLSFYQADPKFYITMEDGEQVPVFDYKNFPFEIFKNAPVHKKKGKTLDRISYIDLACSYDIESTTILNAPEPYSFMYHWQICIEDYVFMGRTWEEFQDFIETITTALHCFIKTEGLEVQGRSLVFYVHNLGFEFMFSHWFIGNMVNAMFTDKYAPLVVPTACGITYRCSYRLTNKSLEKFTEGFKFHKRSGEKYDYTKLRTPATKLSNEDLLYCYCDVRGLSQALRDRFIRDEKYNIANIPLTSTGYCRKDARLAMRRSSQNRTNFLNSKLDAHLYKLCRQAFRGGNTHANAAHIGKHLHNVKSWDLCSSYPAWILTKTYPLGPFIPFNEFNINNLNELLADDKNAEQTIKYIKSMMLTDCLLITIKIYDFEYIGSCGVPYISRSKTLIRVQDELNIKEDNGRIYSCPFAQMTLTDLDLITILKCYKYSEIRIVEAYSSRRGKLNKELRGVIMEYYKQKTALKGLDDPDGSIEYNYNRQKELLNAGYGMMVQRVDHCKYEFIDHEFVKVDQTLQEQLDKFYDSKSSFLSYQHGVWVCAWARFVLQMGLDIAGADTVYCDTDSVKYIGDHEEQFKELNKMLYDNAKRAGAIAYNKDNKEFPIGIFEQEKTYTDFKTLRAKCYIYSYDNGKTIKATISGVSKDIGKKYFTEKGFDALHDGASIEISGKVSATYNNEKPHYIEVDGCRFLTASNIALIPTAYTIKLDSSHLKFVEDMQKRLYAGFN